LQGKDKVFMRSQSRAAVVRQSAAWLLLALCALGIREAVAQDRWEADIRKFEEQDRRTSPPREGIVFVGSSSIRMWDVVKSFPDFPVINRGFGGSQIADSVRYAPRIVIPYAPRLVVFYAGDNDLAASKSAQTVLDDFKAFARVVHEALPETRILFISIKPSFARWPLIDPAREANRLIRDYIATDPRLRFLDVEPIMLGLDGRPRPEIFLKDNLHLNAEGYRIWNALVRPYLEEAMGKRKAQLRVATCQFPVGGDLAENAEWIRRQMREAKAQDAGVVHFPECALSGYAGVDVKDMANFDWSRQRVEIDSILALAKQLRVWVILGAAHPLSDGHKPHDSLYVISPEGRILDRYDKRFCTGGDLKHYSPGDHFVTFDVNGVKCGLLICYDIRFPELYRQYCKMGVRLMFHSFYNARHKEADFIHPKIMPPSAMAHAATNNMFLSVNNSSAPSSWPSLFVTPDGMIQNRLRLDAPGVMVNDVDLTRKYYDASAGYRLDSINGKWNSGDVVDDPRSKDRQSY
jgi:predicted amidohydrolase/lysophospholipase L1-like esterase